MRKKVRGMRGERGRGKGRKDEERKKKIEESAMKREYVMEF